MFKMKVLKIYKLIIYQVLKLTFKDTHDERNGIFIKFYNLFPNQNFEKNAKIY